MPSPNDFSSLEAGDLVWVDLDPVLGGEQAGRRPALVVTTRDYHQISRLCLLAPISSNAGPWPFKYILPAGLAVSGAVLVDQLRSVDRASRIKKRIGGVPPDVLAEVKAKLAATLNID